MSAFYHPVAWTPLFSRLITKVIPYLDKELCDRTSTRIKDGHVIAKRLTASEFSVEDLQLPLVPEVFQVFCSLPHSLGRVHRDGLDRNAALNIPIVGCGKGFAEWFSGEDLNEVIVNSAYTQIRISSGESEYSRHTSLNRLDSLVLTQPHLINTDAWHRVDNTENPDYRFVLSIRFAKNPDFQTVVRAFSEA